MESSGNALAGILFMAFALGVVAVGVMSLVFWVWMLIDCVTKTPSEGNLKLTWVLIIIFAQIVGAIIYFFIQRPKNPVVPAHPT